MLTFKFGEISPVDHDPRERRNILVVPKTFDESMRRNLSPTG